jgi:CheY-like chemotaxis protein
MSIRASGYCEFLKEDLPADSPQYSYVDGIFTAGLRAKELVNQILAFSRQSDSQMIPVELPLLLKEALRLCRSIISSNIDIIQYIQKDCTPIMADPGKLHQIIMNLMINAYHAIGQAGGEIDVHLKREVLEEEDLKGIPVPPGKYAHLSISDTGCGMAPTVLEKIFEPYFTTKDQGKGTGLGLAVVYGIVQEHGGHINADSEVGKGSTFNIYLPLADKSPEAVSAPKTETPQAMDREHILKVDDEEVIIRLERKMLERLGYQVTSCLNGVEALAIFNKRPDDFDLVISDMNMPHMTGDRLVRELLAIRPHLPIIICTGFSEIGGHDDASAMGAKYYLMKPITIAEMSQKVRRALDESRS